MRRSRQQRALHLVCVRTAYVYVTESPFPSLQERGGSHADDDPGMGNDAKRQALRHRSRECLTFTVRHCYVPATTNEAHRGKADKEQTNLAYDAKAGHERGPRDHAVV